VLILQPPKGTPIRASGNGKIIFIGRKGGYGNAIVINHGNHITTLYGHMYHFAKNMKTGTPVHQGEVIGYVGMTGLATGPHLHYEFRVDNTPRNPLTVKLPSANPLPKSDWIAFEKRAKKLLATLNTYQEQLLALKQNMKTAIKS